MTLQPLGGRDGVLRWLATIALLAPLASPAQRVQIPATGSSPVQAAPGWGAAPKFAPPAATGAALPPPAFDAYSVAPSAPPIYSAPVGPPPAALPYSYAPPVASPTAPAYAYGAPPPSAGLYPEGSSLGWQPGTYGFQQSDGGVTRFRQFFARLRAEHTLLLGDNSADALEWNRTELASTFAVPMFGSIDEPLLVTPGFAFNWIGGPEADPAAMSRGPDLPPRVYDAYLDFAWHPRWTPELGAELGFRTGVWTDFQEFNGDTIRYLGRGLGVVTITPQFELLLGAVYLDRLRVKTLPAGGVRWRPSPEWDLYLVFPNPKIRRTLASTGSADWWWYLSGEYGGGSWTVEREGLRDRFDYNDLRVSLGLEWETPTQARGHLEIGYAFDRELRFDSDAPGRAKVDDAVMFRAGIGF
ncbi:MAG: hypothetical protein AAF805_10750 [Planctomycetota bacterium]